MLSHIINVTILYRCIVFVAQLAMLLTLFASPAHGGGTLFVCSGTQRLSQDETYDLVCICFGAVLETNNHTLTIDVGGTLDCDGTLSIENNGTVVIQGGNQFVNGTIRLLGPNSLLHITDDTTLGSAGEIAGLDPDATIQIDQGATLTSELLIQGTLTIVGPGTLENMDKVVATSNCGNTIVLDSDLILADITGALWKAQGGTLQFKHQQTAGGALLGNVSCTHGGTLHFFQSVTFDGGIACGLGGPTFSWSGSGWAVSWLKIEPNKTFTYKCFSSNCTNPDPGSSPFSVTAGGSQFSQSCNT